MDFFGMNSGSPTELSLSCINYQYVTLVNHARQPFHINPDVGFKCQGVFKGNYSVCIILCH